MVTSLSWPTVDASMDNVDDESKDRQKKPRHRHSAVQLAALNELYDKDEHPSLEQRTSLAKKLGMETKTVNAWFQNKRASTKKRQYTRLNPTPKPPKPKNFCELPPISALLASTPSPSSSAPVARSVQRPPPQPVEYEYDDYIDEEELPSRTHLPPIDSYQQHQAPFFTERRHVIEATQEPVIPRKMRFRPTPHQTEELRKVYNVNPHPSKEDREALGFTIGMRYQSVTNWFQNQRSLSKKRKEDDSEAHYSDAPSISDTRRTRTSSPATYSAFPPASSHPSLPVAVPPTTSLHPSLRPSTPPPSRGMPYPIVGDVRSRPRRSRPEPFQLEKLKDLFRRTTNPSIEERGALALEVGMDLNKVTNWFRNLRQTARKRGGRIEDFLDEMADADTNFSNISASGSTEVSRAGTPSMFVESSASSSSSTTSYEVEYTGGMDVMVMNMGYMEPDSNPSGHLYAHSDASDEDEEYQEEVVTPPTSPPHNTVVDVRMSNMPEWEERAGMGKDSVSGVTYEDAILLLTFHHRALIEVS